MSAQNSRSQSEQKLQKASRRNSVSIIIYCSLFGYVLGMWLVSHNLNTRPKPPSVVLLYDTIQGKDTVLVDSLQFLPAYGGDSAAASGKGKLDPKRSKSKRGEDEEAESLVVVNCGCCPGDSAKRLDQSSSDESDPKLAAALAMMGAKGNAAHLPRRATKQPISRLLMNRHPKLLIWSALVCLMVAFAFACAPIFIDQWLKLRALFSDLDLALGWNIFSALLVGVVLFMAPLWMAGLWLPDHFAVALGTFFGSPWAFKGPLLLTILSAGTGIAIMFSIASGISQLGSEKLDINSATELGEKFDALNKALQISLQLLAIMVVFAVLTSNTMRLAVRSLLVEKTGDVLFPIEFVQVYGLFFSAVLAIIYLPIHYRLNQVGQAISEKLKASLPTPATPAVAPPSSGLLQRVFNQLSITGTGLENLKTALSILAPIITALLADFAEK